MFYYFYSLKVSYFESEVRNTPNFHIFTNLTEKLPYDFPKHFSKVFFTIPVTTASPQLFCTFTSISSISEPNHHVGDNYKWWWQNPNFGDPHGYLVGKHMPFGQKISFLACKKTLEPFRARFENTMGNPFFDFVKYRPKRSIFFFRIVII